MTHIKTARGKRAYVKRNTTALKGKILDKTYKAIEKAKGE